MSGSQAIRGARIKRERKKVNIGVLNAMSWFGQIARK